jgi:hypothetical protein
MISICETLVEGHDEIARKFHSFTHSLTHSLTHLFMCGYICLRC